MSGIADGLRAGMNEVYVATGDPSIAGLMIAAAERIEELEAEIGSRARVGVEEAPSGRLRRARIFGSYDGAALFAADDPSEVIASNADDLIVWVEVEP